MDLGVFIIHQRFRGMCVEKETAAHSSVHVWRVPWTEEPGGLHGVAKSQTRLSDFCVCECVCMLLSSY